MQQMKELGLQNVRKEEVLVPVWIRGEESLELSAPIQYEIAMLGLGMSVGTPPGGIEAEVLVVGSFEDLARRSDAEVAGKLVLFDVPYVGYGRTVPYRSRGAIAAAERGAVAALVRSIGPDGQRLPHTGTTSYDEAVPKIPAAAVSSEDASMMRRMQERDDRIVARLEMGARTEPDKISHNVIGEVIGRELPEEIVVVRGHIDSWDVRQGAQDDGVGCMISLGAAASTRARSRRTRPRWPSWPGHSPRWRARCDPERRRPIACADQSACSTTTRTWPSSSARRFGFWTNCTSTCSRGRSIESAR